MVSAHVRGTGVVPLPAMLAPVMPTPRSAVLRHGAPPSLRTLAAHAVVRHTLKSAWTRHGCLPQELVDILTPLNERLHAEDMREPTLRWYDAVDPASDDSMAFDEGNRLLTNPNAVWVNKHFRSCYLITILLCLALIRVMFEHPWARVCTTVNMAHFVVSYVVFHALKGNFGVSECRYCDAGEYDTLTLWEQIDGGQRKSFNRNFFIAVVIGLLLITMHAVSHDPVLVMINSSASLVLLIAKLPSFMYVRLGLVYEEQRV